MVTHVRQPLERGHRRKIKTTKKSAFEVKRKAQAFKTFGRGKQGLKASPRIWGAKRPTSGSVAKKDQWEKIVKKNWEGKNGANGVQHKAKLTKGRGGNNCAKRAVGHGKKEGGNSPEKSWVLGGEKEPRLLDMQGRMMVLDVKGGGLR